MLSNIEFDGVQETERAELLAYINAYCIDMTLAEARDCLEAVRLGESRTRQIPPS